jgi:hypothetical protein
MVQVQMLQRPVFAFIFFYFLAAKSSKNCRRLVAIGPSYEVPEQLKAMADGDCIRRRPTSRGYAMSERFPPLRWNRDPVDL